MTSTATEHLQIARDYLDSIPEAKPRAGTDIYQPTLQSLAAATKHLEAAAKTDPKATLTVDDPNTKQSTTHTLDELRSEALYYEGFAHAHYGLSVSDVEKGVVAIQKAILHKPYSAIYHSQLGYAFLRLG